MSIIIQHICSSEFVPLIDLVLCFPLGKPVRGKPVPIEKKPGFWNIICKEDIDTNDGLSKQEIQNSKNETKTPHLNNMKAQSKPHHIRHLVRYYFILHTVKY